MSKSSSEINDSSYSITKQGLRFRLKKRTYKEMIEEKEKTIINNDRNNNNNPNVNGNANVESDNIDDDNDIDDEEYLSKPKMKQRHKAKGKGSVSDKTISNAINYNNNVNCDNYIKPPLPTQSNLILFKEAERFKSTLAKFAYNFKNEQMPKLVTIVSKVCSKLIKKKSISCEGKLKQSNLISLTILN